MNKWLMISLFFVPLVAAHGDNGFESPSLDPGQTFSITFDEPGTVEYACEIHPFMTGSITVVASTNQAQNQTIRITDGSSWGFEPESIEVAAGDTVTWLNAGTETHRIGGNLPVPDQEAPGFAAIGLIAIVVLVAAMRR